MSVEMWAVPLSFTCLVVLLGFVANGAVRLVHNSREKRKTLHRVSVANMQLANAKANTSSALASESLPRDLRGE
jgi:hypothetical protein